MHPSPSSPSLSIRVNASNLDHHLWRNHGNWWIHYVVHEGNRKRRVRFSLGTEDVVAARSARDRIFETFRAKESGAPCDGASVELRRAQLVA